MRKSERLRMLEVEVIKMQYQLEILTAALSQIMASNQSLIPDMDSGKWYEKKQK